MKPVIKKTISIIAIILTLAMAFCATAFAGDEGFSGIGDNTYTSYEQIKEGLEKYGTASVSKQANGTIVIDVLKNIRGRMCFNFPCDILFNANGKTITGSNTKEPICLQNSSNSSITLTGNGVYSTGINNAIFIGTGCSFTIYSAHIKGKIYSYADINLAIAPGNTYFTATNNGRNMFDTEKVTENKALKGINYRGVANMIITQGYESPKVNISFNNNGATGSMDSLEVDKGSVTLPECTLTPPEGKHFKSWKVSGEGNFEFAPGTNVTVDSDITVTPVWENHDFAIEDTSEIYLKSEATCKRNAEYFYSCKCGEKGTEAFNYGYINPYNHALNPVLNSLNEKQHGYIYPCCESAVPEQSPQDHVFENGVCTECGYVCSHEKLEWVIDKQPTLTETGLKHQECVNCGIKKDETEIEKLTEEKPDIDKGDKTPKDDKTNKPSKDDAPKTGDNANSALFIILFVLASATAIAIILSKKRA